jgi:signal transduction histidine kinase
MITEQSAQMQQGMSDIVWAIAPDNDKLENMVIRMREYVAHTLEPKNIRTVFGLDEKQLSKSLSMEQRRDFFLLFKEAINNAAKYSGATRVDVRLWGDSRKLCLGISDDGVGFDAGASRSSNGLRNMRVRAEALQGLFCIDTAPGKGTKITVEMTAT